MYSILLVDDEQIERMALAKRIEKYYGDKVSIYQAVNGREAVDMCNEERKDIIIMDISMPELNGVMAARYIRQIDDRCMIVFLSAYDDFNYARNAIKVRALDYLLKPCDKDELIAVMDMAMQKLDNTKDKDYVLKDNIDGNNNIIEQNSELNDCEELANENYCIADEKAIVYKMKEYVENNYMYDISMQEAAASMGYSDAYFSKLFKKYFNQNFTAYLTEYRVKKAKKLISETNESIKDISRMVGYTDSNYFAKIFKRVTGEIPSKYRDTVVYR